MCTLAIVVQGGAGSYPKVSDQKERDIIVEAMRVAAKTGYSVLKGGGSAVDAVQAAACFMEDNPLFNAGYGSCLTREYTIEMDASIMDGKDLKTGAVACITNVRNPILVARAVMDKTAHTMLCGQAATKFAENEGFEIIPTESLITKKSIDRLESLPDFKPSVKKEFYEKLEKMGQDVSVMKIARHPDEHDTVGAVAVDCHGNVAYATTTGGISAKMCGRVGDSPIVGCGGYADNRSGAISTTGHGETFVKMCTAKHAAMLMELGKTPQDAIKDALDLTLERTGGLGGAVAINARGDVGIYMTSEGMAWASIVDDVTTAGIFKNEVIKGEGTYSST